MWSILAGVVLLIFLVYFRINLIVVVPVSIVFISLLNGISPFDILTGPYASGAASFIEDFIFIFLLGAILGRIMKDSGAAETMAQHIFRIMGEKYAAIAVFLTASLLGYGGIVSFVMIFALLPIGRSIFKKAGLPELLLPACIAGGISGFAVMAPGSPQVQNIIPMEYLGTSAMAGALIGFAATAVSTLFIIFYLSYRTKKIRAAGVAIAVSKIEKNAVISSSVSGKSDQGGEDSGEGDVTAQKTPGIIIAPLPLISVIILLAGFQTTPVLALLTGTLLAVFLFYRYLPSFIETINGGTRDSAVPLLYAASAIGFGLALRSFPALLEFTGIILNSSLNPYFIAALITNLGSAAMGSAAGGILVTISLMGNDFISNLNPSILHRILTMSSSVLDTMPHNNVYLAMLLLAGLSIRDTFKDYFVTTVIAPLAGLITAFAILSLY